MEMKWAGRVVGIVTLIDLMRVPRDRWARTYVEAAMVPMGRLASVRPADQVLAVLERIQQGARSSASLH
jgi:CBS domain-containing protein